mgnify:CR=1 FL=1
MIIRRSPQSPEASSSEQSAIHAHGPKDGVRERVVVWPLSGADEARAELGYAALKSMLDQRGMNGCTPELARKLGSITAALGRVEYDVAETLAQAGLAALELAEGILRQQMADGNIEVGVGVGLSAAVVTFPDRQD